MILNLIILIIQNEIVIYNKNEKHKYVQLNIYSIL
jgi:hypothetical protein